MRGRMPAPLSPRFDRTARVLGPEAMERLARAHVVVIGLGGVGSFAAEALARAGVGRLTLCDGERIDETNVNRQLHALEGEVGRFKAEVLAERYRRVNPAAVIEAVCERYGEETAERIVPEGVSFAVDAADTVVAKLHLIARCITRGIPLVTSMGAARRIDPTAVEVTDLCETHTDQLAKDVRKYLRRHHGLSATAPTGVLAVWSREPPRETLALPWDEELGVPGVRRRPEGELRREPKCFGSVAFVTGVFGLAAAGAVIQRLAGVEPATPRDLPERERKRRTKKVTSPRRR